MTLDGSHFNVLYNLWLEPAEAVRRDETSAWGQQFVTTAPAAFFDGDIRRVRQYLETPRGAR